MENEIFKPIIGYEGLYEISNFGRVKSVLRDIILNPFSCGDNYRGIGLRKKGIKKTILIHTLVGLYFVDNPKNLNEINHLDFDRCNNRWDNLEWSTHGDNIRYSYIKGNRTGTKGESSPVAKHTNQSVLKIRELYKSGIYTQQQLADMFNVKRHNINKIITRQSWKHI